MRGTRKDKQGDEQEGEEERAAYTNNTKMRNRYEEHENEEQMGGTGKKEAHVGKKKQKN